MDLNFTLKVVYSDGRFGIEATADLSTTERVEFDRIDCDDEWELAQSISKITQKMMKLKSEKKVIEKP